MTTQPTQVRRPWRAVARTAFQALVGLAAMAPVIYQAATSSDPAKATGAVGLALGISAAVTRVMALPGVNGWLERFVPFLAADVPRYKIGDRVAFTIEGQTIRGEVVGIRRPPDTRYAVAGDDGEVRSLWERGIRR